MTRPLRPHTSPAAARQQGQALLTILIIVGVAITALVFYFANPARLAIARDKKTEEALAQAKVALIGFAAGVGLSSGAARPGDLPCPDLDNNGFADVAIDTPCSGGALGRLPWKSLGLPDLRDGNGERLWYAVSSNFKNSPRTPCASPGDTGCLNSDTRGTITVRDGSGAVINDGSNPNEWTPSGAIAVIIAPAAVLQRQDVGTPQDRSCTVGVNCDVNERCTTSPPSATPKCNPVNYLDISGTEDNANFIDGDNTNGFINGNVVVGGNVVVNDRLLAIRYEDLMPLLKRRVVKELMNCLTAYAAVPQNNGRYPWAAPVANYPSFADQSEVRFGRIPDTFSATFLGVSVDLISDTVCPATPALCMATSWPAPPSCNITTGSWWNNWKELVFYGVAEAYQPADPVSSLLPVPPGGPCGNCLTVDPPASASDKRVVVIVSGKRLSAVASGQPRNWPSPPDKSSAANYLEDNNNGSPTQNVYTQKPTTTTFNDVLLYQ